MGRWLVSLNAGLAPVNQHPVTPKYFGRFRSARARTPAPRDTDTVCLCVSGRSPRAGGRLGVVEPEVLTLADVREAAERIRGRVAVSPCAESAWLSELTDTCLYLKLENLQHTGSFKERGACNRLLLLTDDERARGVITASAGNQDRTRG